MKILVVEDEIKIAQALKHGLSAEGYAVDLAHDGEEGYLSATADNYDLIITDVMMPIIDGIQMCQKLRSEGVLTPILILTAKDQQQDIVSGLDSGADDYLPKPFSFEILLARVRALLRRPPSTTSPVLSYLDLTLNPNTKEVTRVDKIINLSTKEFAILEYLMRNQGQVLSKNNIISHVWDFESDVLPNNLEVFLTYLRNKIDKPFAGPKIIETVRGFGYKIG